MSSGVWANSIVTGPGQLSPNTTYYLYVQAIRGAVGQFNTNSNLVNLGGAATNASQPGGEPNVSMVPTLLNSATFITSMTVAFSSGQSTNFNFGYNPSGTQFN